MKKTLTIIGIVLIISFIILGLWYLFTSKKGASPSDSPENTDQSGNFFPTNQGGKIDPLFGGDLNDEINNDSGFIPQFRQLSQVPVAGMISFERLATSTDNLIDQGDVVSTTTETVFRYIERGTGHIFETTERTITQERISNVTFPQIQKAFFNESGNIVFLQFFSNDNETLQTFHGAINQISTTTEGGNDFKDSKLETNFFSNEMYDVVPSYNNASTFSLTKTDGGAIIQNTPFSSPSLSSVTSLLLSNWNIQSPNNKTVTLTTKAHSETPGYLYFYDISLGRKTRILGPVNGLTTNTSPSGQFVLFSNVRAGQIETSVYDVKNNTALNLVIQTLPEKCIWKETDEVVLYCAVPATANRNPLPESWYQGTTFFNDDIWKITIREEGSPSYQTILEPSNLVDKTFDITNIQLSQKGEYLLFINKNDLNLWSLDVTSF